MIQSLLRKIRLLASRAVINLIAADGKVQRFQVNTSADEVLDNVEHLEPYGFTAHPHKGSEALVLSLAGNRGHSVCIVAGGRKFRMKNLAEGEVALYTDEGDFIHFKREREIHVTADSKLTVTAADASFSGNVSIAGNLSVAGDSSIGGNESIGGNSTVTGNVSAAAVAASGALSGASASIGGKDFSGHTHGGVDTGNGTTGAVS